jgi:tetratricopeptide (TPR) repeat protein
MKIVQVILFIGLVICQSACFTQIQQKLINKAEKLEVLGDYKNAAQLYIDASDTLNRKTTLENTQYSIFKAAECQQVLGNDSIAFFFYDQALRLNYNEVDPKIYWNLGELFYKGDAYLYALTNFNLYKKQMPNDTLVDSRIKACENYDHPIFVDLFITFCDEYDFTEKTEVRVTGTDGLDTLIFTNSGIEVRLDSNIIKVGYDYTIEILSNSRRLGNRDMFSTKNIIKSTRIIREISILYGCRRDNLLYDDSLIFIDLILVLRNFETNEIVPLIEVTLKSTMGKKYFFRSDENGEIYISQDEQGDRIIKINQEYKIIICDFRQPVLDGYIRFNTYGFSNSVRIVKEVAWSECD